MRLGGYGGAGWGMGLQMGRTRRGVGQGGCDEGGGGGGCEKNY